MSKRAHANHAVVQWLLGFTALALAWFVAYQRDIDLPWISGFLAGMTGGFISAGCLEAYRITDSRNQLLKWVAVTTSPLIVMPIVPWATTLAVAYFLGYAVTFLFNSAVLALLHAAERQAAQMRPD